MGWAVKWVWMAGPAIVATYICFPFLQVDADQCGVQTVGSGTAGDGGR